MVLNIHYGFCDDYTKKHQFHHKEFAGCKYGLYNIFSLGNYEDVLYQHPQNQSIK